MLNTMNQKYILPLLDININLNITKTSKVFEFMLVSIQHAHVFKNELITGKGIIL